MGIPIIEVLIDNEMIKLFLDTGARISYLSYRFTNRYQSSGIEEDVHPLIGNFTTDSFDIETIFGNSEFLVRYGNLPNLFQSTLQIANTEGIIGFDFFNNFKFLLNIKNNIIKL